MNAEHLPHMTFRDEIINALRLIEQTPEPNEFPAWPPSDILAMLDVTGPRLGDGALPLLQMVLDDMYEQGEVGRVPAPTRRHAARYCTRGAAEAAIRRGFSIILKPLSTTEETLPRLMRGRHRDQRTEYDDDERTTT